MKTGLVLEGGAMRGMYTAGVLDIFMEQGITFDGIIGVSAGALFGVNFLSGQKGRAIRYNKRFNGDPEYMGIRPLLKTGNIVSTEYAYERVPRELDPFDDEIYMAVAAKVPFYAGITNIETGLPEYVRITSVFAQMDMLRASGSMPFVSRPVQLDGMLYLDGGISDSIPWHKMRQLGYDRLVVILTRDKSYQKEPMSPALIHLFYHRRKGFARTLRRRHIEYADSIRQLEALEKAGSAILIRPSSPITIGRLETDPEKMEAVYQLGIRDTEAVQSAVQRFCRSKP